MVDERQSGRTGRGGQEGMSAAELAEAISRARGGNADAWGELYRLYAAPIFRFCRRALPSREDAEDATMEIFVKLREKLGQYDPAGHSPPGSTRWPQTTAGTSCGDGGCGKTWKPAKWKPCRSHTPTRVNSSDWWRSGPARRCARRWPHCLRERAWRWCSATMRI